MTLYPTSRKKGSLYPTTGSGQGDNAGAITGSATLNFGDTATQTSADLTMTVVGARVGDKVLLGHPTPEDDTSYSAYVSDVDTVTVRFNNYSGDSVDPGSGVFNVSVVPSR